MLSASSQLEAAIRTGSFDSKYVADLIVDGEPVLRDVALPLAELVSDASGKVVTKGTATFHYSDALGTSIVPETMTSWLTPVASFLDVSYVVEAGSFSEKVLQGRLKIVGVSDPEDRRISNQGRVLSVGSSVRLTLADLFAVTDRERFLVPSGPSQLGSVWEELARITGLPVTRSLPDVPFTRPVTFKESRLDAVMDLGTLLGGFPYVDANSTVTAAPIEWGEPVAHLTMGARGTISRADPDDLSSDKIYNQVVVRSWDDQQATILATAEVKSGPLRYGGPFGRIPYFASSQYVTTETQAKEYAESLLPTVSRMPAVTYSIQCAPDPRLQVWDVIEFDRNGQTLTGRISKRTLPGTGSMSLTVEVA